MKKWYFLIISIIVLSSCMPAGPKPQELLLPPQPLIHNGFSLLPPAESGWIVAHRSPHQLALAKRGDHLDESYAIQVVMLQLPIFNTDEQFAQYVTQGTKKDTDESRFKNSHYETTIVNGISGNCIKTLSTTEDTQAQKQSSSTESMILEIIQFTCKHPSNNTVGVNFGYSHRYYAGNADPNLNSKAEMIFKNFNFTQL